MQLGFRSGLVATALAVVALAAPNALAVRYYPPPASTTSQASGGHELLRAESAQLALAHGGTTASAPTPSFTQGTRFVCTPRGVAICTPIPTTHASTRSGSHGFEFGDAAIGALVAAGLVLLGMASTLAVRWHRQPVHS